MNILVTAGNTQVPIDRVRCITNVFTGRTGTGIAIQAFHLGHQVTLLTSRPDAVSRLESADAGEDQRLRVLPFRTFDDLDNLMDQELTAFHYHAVIHCAAVSDYHAAGIFAPAPSTHFSPDVAAWTGSPPALVDRAAAKVKSDEPELWLRLVRAPKLVDKVRTVWLFRGVLVKFKLEVSVSDQQLLEIAERSRRHSDADLMVANTLEGSQEWALLGPLNGGYQRICRRELPDVLIAAVQAKHKERTHG